jgi:hypothetical protein
MERGGGWGGGVFGGIVIAARRGMGLKCGRTLKRPGGVSAIYGACISWLDDSSSGDRLLSELLEEDRQPSSIISPLAVPPENSNKSCANRADVLYYILAYSVLNQTCNKQR